MSPYQHGWLFRFSCHLLKYFFFGFYGFAVACIAGVFLGAYLTIIDLLVILIPWLLKGGVLILSLMFLGILQESMSR